ncbi:MAG: DUF1987 domain-containing protein [Chthoniobacterales bacterium]
MIPESETSPRVTVTGDANESTLSFEGESYPENVIEFYAPIIAWLEKNVHQIATLHVRFRLYYLNTGSSKAILDLIRRLEVKGAAGARIDIEWHHLPDLEIMRRAGEDLLADTSLPHRVVAIL